MSASTNSTTASNGGGEQGMPSVVQGQVMSAVAASMQQQHQNQGGLPQVSPGVTTPADMASVLAKIQALEREKADLRAQLESTNTALSKYREEKSIGMKEKYSKEIKDFIDMLQLKDPEVKKLMHDRMEALANQGNETGVWEILACASSNHRANVNQIESLTNEINSYKETFKQYQGGSFQAESSRIDTSSVVAPSERGTKRSEPEGGFSSHSAVQSSTSYGDAGSIWGDFHDMIMREGGNRGIDFSQGGGYSGGRVSGLGL